MDNTIVEGARPDNGHLNTEDIRLLVSNQVAESIQRLLPQLLTESLQKTGLTKRISSPEVTVPDTECSEETLTKKQKVDEGSSEMSRGRSSRFYTEPNQIPISGDLLEFLTSTFTKPLSKDVWTALLDKYPEIKGTENVLVAPTMETGMKEDIKKKHGYLKTKEVFSFDDGLAERQAPLLTAVRPIIAALEALEISLDEEGESPGPDPDDIKVMLEDSLALLGNAVFRLNAWRQKRFSEFLTDLGKRTLKSDLPADKHLFPDSFHKVVQSEHDHSQTNSKLVATGNTMNGKQPFKKSSNTKQFFRRQPFQVPSGGRKRTWGNRWNNQKESSKPKGFSYSARSSNNSGKS